MRLLRLYGPLWLGALLLGFLAGGVLDGGGLVWRLPAFVLVGFVGGYAVGLWLSRV